MSVEGPICSVQKYLQGKAAKVETGKHFGWSGKWSYVPILHNLPCRLSVLLEWRPTLTAVIDGSCVAAFQSTFAGLGLKTWEDL